MPDDPMPKAAPTDRLTYCPVCLSFCQNGIPWPPIITATAGSPPAHCPGWKRNPSCNSYTPAPAT